jgi:integrase
VRQRTYERHESIVRVHLVPALGNVKLSTLTPAHVRSLYREKLDSGLAPRTVLHIHRTLSKALKQAADDGLIPAMPRARLSLHDPAQKRYGPWTASRSELYSTPPAKSETGWKLFTSWLLPQGSGVANCRALNAWCEF